MGLLAAWFTQQLVSDSVPTGETLETTEVVVVRADVPVATTLTGEFLETAEWPSNHVPRGALRSTDEAVGRVVRRPVAAGEPVLEMALFEIGASGGLPAVIQEGSRAVTVKVDNVIGVAGFVTPGARVDVMATLRRIDRQHPLPFSKVILQNIKVLAIDQKLEEARTGAPEIVSVVTLEVEPLQAQHLIYSAHEGRLQLAMRSPGDQAEVASRGVGVVDVLGTGGGKKKTRVAGTPVQILNGTKLQTRRF
jgi:pilus assembly protein CpaB